MTSQQQLTQNVLIGNCLSNRRSIGARSGFRSGLSLVELMIVIAIIVTLAAVVLPTFKTALRDQKITQATRQVKGYFEAARSKAIAGGRPVGVLLDRVSYADSVDGGDPIPKATCVRLSLVEVLPPYTGDLQGATALLQDPGSLGYATVARLSKAYCPAAIALIRNGDLISFGNNPTKFYITGITDPDSSDPAVPYAVSFVNPPWGTEPQWAVGSGTFNLPFRVHRKASKSLAGSLTLPRGICIDLSGSGIGTTGRDFATDVISASVLGGGGTLPTGANAGNFGAVYVVFGPNGNVDYVFPSPLTMTGGATLTTYDVPRTTIHFLLGKTDQVSPANVLSPFDGTQVIESRDALVGNLMDPESSWVSINPFNGNIYSSKVGGVVVPATPANFTIPFRTLQARQFAGQVSAEGGR